MNLRPTARTARRVAAALAITWIGVMLPFAGVPGLQAPAVGPLDWRLRYLGVAAHVGSVAAGLVYGVWMHAIGAVQHPELGLRFVPLSARAWFFDAVAWGAVLGTACAIAVLPWVLWVVSRIVARRDRSGRDPSLVLASGWSALVLLPRLGSILVTVLVPTPAWLVMPPFGAHAGTPDATWCAYSYHTRASECATALNDARYGHAAGFGHFQYADARCIPDAELARASPHEASVARLASALEGVLGGDATVRQDVDLGGDHVDVAVTSGERVLLAADVEIRRWEEQVRPPRATLLSHGVVDYWRVIVHPNRDPAMLDEVEQWRADAATHAFTIAGGSSRNRDVSLRIAAVPSLRLPINDVLPDPCDVETPDHPIVRTVNGPGAPPRAPEWPFAFIVDGSVEPAVLELGDLDPSGHATRLRFVASSTRPRGFDPAATGLVVDVGGLFFEEDVLHAVLPAHEQWTRSADGWSFRSEDGAARLEVHVVDADPLVWRIDGTRGRYRFPRADAPWPSIAVQLRTPGDSRPDAGAAIHFPLTGVFGCNRDATGGIACRGPSKPTRCAEDPAEGPDFAMRCTAEQVAQGQRTFFATHGRYFGGVCPDVAVGTLPGGVVCMLTATTSDFQVIVMRPGSTHRQGCRWSSATAHHASPFACS